MKPRKQIASLVTRVEQGLSDSAKDLGDLALQKYREVHLRQGLATALDRARQELADKLTRRRKKAKARPKAVGKSKQRGTKAKRSPSSGRKPTRSGGKAKTGVKTGTAARSRSRSRSRPER